MNQIVPTLPDFHVRRATVDEVMGILISGDFQSILGIREDVRVEFKRELDLRQESGRHKLAKAVSALANSGGGLLVVGVGTERDPTTRSDYASQITYLESVDESVYYKVLAELLYPLTKVKTETFGTAQHYLISISVDAAELEATVLVTKTIGESLNGGTIFGYYKRTEIESTHVKHAEVHALIQAGQRLQQIGDLKTSIDQVIIQLASIEKTLQILKDGKQL